MTQRFALYGFRVELTSDRADVLQEVTREFAWFGVPPERVSGRNVRYA